MVLPIFAILSANMLLFFLPHDKALFDMLTGDHVPLIDYLCFCCLYLNVIDERLLVDKSYNILYILGSCCHPTSVP